jgi:hypothetical protein
VTSSQFCGCSLDSSGNLVVTQLSAGACTTPGPGGTCNTSGVAGNYVTVTARTPSANPYLPMVSSPARTILSQQRPCGFNEPEATMG